MVGIVNSIGVQQVARTEASQRDQETNRDTAPKEAPVLNSELAVNRVLDVAIESIQLVDSDVSRQLPGNGQSDVAQQTEVAAKPAPDSVGRYLDIVA